MKKLTAAVVLSLSTTATSSLALASDATLRIGEEALSLYLSPQASQTHSTELGLVYNSKADVTVLNGGLFANGQREQFSGRLGGKLYYANLDGDSGFGVALGGDLNFALSQDLSLNGGIYFGPPSISFSDVDRYSEWFLKARYQVLDNGAISGGYGSFKLEPKKGRDFTVDKSLFIEMTLSF